MGVTLLHGVEILLPHGPIDLRAKVELAGAIHGQAGRFVRDDQPVHPIDIRLALTEVLRMPLEDRLHVRLIALQDEGAGADGGLRFFQISMLLHQFRSDDPHGPGVGQRIDQPDEGLFEQKLHGVAVHHLDPVQRLQHIAVGIPLFCHEAVVGKMVRMDVS